MRIALLGGTGDIGEGLALRWAYHSPHEVIIGSRDPDRARKKAADYEATLAAHDVSVSLNGFQNPMAADRADVAVLSVPPYYVSDTIESVSDRLTGTILVSPAVEMTRDDAGFHYDPPPAGSVTALAAAAAPDETPVVGAFHNLPAGRLADLDASLGLDVLLVSDDTDAKATIHQLTEAIDGLRALDAGSIANAPEVESITPLLVTIAHENQGLADLGVQFT